MSRTPQLVCQHIENVSRNALEKYQEIVRNYVFRRQGVYALYRRGKLYYVGLASDLRGRLKTHLSDRHGKRWDRFSLYLTIGDKHLKELESLLLRVIRPKPLGNKKVGKFTKSEDLRGRFTKDVRMLLRTELNLLMGRMADESTDRKTPRPRGRVPPLARYIDEPFAIRARSRGRTFHGRVRRNGTIRLRGKVFRSPTAAAVSVARYPVDGWRFWKYERAPGDWVCLDELRR